MSHQHTPVIAECVQRAGAWYARVICTGCRNVWERPATADEVQTWLAR